MQRKPEPEHLARRLRMVHRPGVRALLRSLLTAASLFAAYYLLPLEQAFTTSTVLALLGGLAALTAILTWQVRAIARSPHPRLRAVESLATTLPLFLLLFAAAYFLMERSIPRSFSEPLSRTDSLYFTVSIFSTVGFGDIAARTEAARLLTTGQIVGDLVIIGVIARVMVSAVEEGVRRHPHNPLRDPPTDDQPTG